jgi:hypothetical protein
MGSDMIISRSRIADRMGRCAKANKSGNLHFCPPSGVEVWCPTEEKDYRINIIPYLITKKNHPDGILSGEEFQIGEDWYRRPYGIHSKVGGIRDVICPLVTFKKPCPICEEVLKLSWNDDAELIRTLRPKRMMLYNLYHPKQNTYSIFDWSKTKFSDVLEGELLRNSDKSLSNFVQLEGGMTLTIRSIQKVFAGQKFFTIDRIDFSPSPRDTYPKSVLENAPKLDDVFTEMPYEDIKELFMTGKKQLKDRIEETEETHTPVQTRIKQASVKSVQDDDDAPPVRPTRPIKSVQEDDDDDVPVVKAKPTVKKPQFEDSPSLPAPTDEEWND